MLSLGGVLKKKIKLNVQKEQTTVSAHSRERVFAP